MNTRAPRKPPERIALLPDREALKHLTAAVLQGKEDLPQSSIAAACVEVGEEERWRVEPVREVIDEAMERFADTPTKSDAWLAPRLHAALRITRREAADSGLWNFLALRLAPDYVLWRWGGKVRKGAPEPANPRRFCGPFHSQAFSRLWWAAELFRSGSDYRPVEVACGNQEMFNQVLRKETIHHRPIAQAIVRLMQQGTIGQTRELGGLDVIVNVAGSTLCYEFIGSDEPQDADAYRAWMDEAGSAYIPFDSLPEGPDDSGVPPAAVEALFPLLEKLFSEAPIRGREKAQTEAIAG